MDDSASQTPTTPILQPDKHRQLPWLAVVLSLLVLGVIGALVFQNLKLKKQLSSITPPPIGGSPISPVPSTPPIPFPSPTPSLLPIQIPTLSTANWKTVSQNNISFQIPPFASCNSNTNCTHVSYNGRDDVSSGQPIPYDIYISVDNYAGGSRREYFLIKNIEVRDCRPFYVESLFGPVSALQIAVDGGFCQGNSGGIVAVIGNKIVVFGGGLYMSENKYIGRWPIRDTIISTLQASGS